VNVTPAATRARGRRASPTTIWTWLDGTVLCSAMPVYQAETTWRNVDLRLPPPRAHSRAKRHRSMCVGRSAAARGYRWVSVCLYAEACFLSALTAHALARISLP